MGSIGTSKQGLLYVSIRITDPKQLSWQLFEKWYNEVKFKDMISTGGIYQGLRYHALDEDVECPVLVFYPLKDLSWLQSKEFHSIPMCADFLPWPGHAMNHKAAFDVRSFEPLNRHEKAGVSSAPAEYIYVTYMGPSNGGDAELNAWYEDEHLPGLSKCSGYIRSRRYRLLDARYLSKDSRVVEGRPRYFAVHEFENRIPYGEIIKANESAQSIKIYRDLRQYEEGGFRLVKTIGDVENGY